MHMTVYTPAVISLIYIVALYLIIIGIVGLLH